MLSYSLDVAHVMFINSNGTLLNHNININFNWWRNKFHLEEHEMQVRIPLGLKFFSYVTRKRVARVYSPGAKLTKVT